MQDNILIKSEQETKQHAWAQGSDVGFKPGGLLYSTWLCKCCGMLKSETNANGACKGHVRVTLRNQS